MDNLLEAWQEFVRGKRSKPDVQKFSVCLMDNILSLYHDLQQQQYKHGKYKAFTITDPKLRKIHKARVRDRLLHHAIYRILYPFYEKFFISDSFSCRLDKGTHKAVARFRKLYYKASKNNTKTCWVLKCDIKKFFDSVDHEILYIFLKERIKDQKILWLLREIMTSFNKEFVQLELFDLPKQIERERERDDRPLGEESPLAILPANYLLIFT